MTFALEIVSGNDPFNRISLIHVYCIVLLGDALNFVLYIQSHFQISLRVTVNKQAVTRFNPTMVMQASKESTAISTP